jgi:hypothetical protein
MRDAGKAAIMIMTELELVAPVVIAFLVATLNLEWPQGRVGGPYMRFSTPTAPKPRSSPRISPVAFVHLEIWGGGLGWFDDRKPFRSRRV